MTPSFQKNTETNLEELPSTKIPQEKSIQEKVTSTSILFARNTIVATLVVIALHWADINFKIFDRFLKLGNEFIASALLGVVSTVAQSYVEREKEKIEIAQQNSLANNELITRLTTRLENQINSLMLQNTQVSANLNDLYGGLELAKRDERALDQKVDENHYDVQKERFKLLKLFYEEIMQIKVDLAYLKGVNEGDSLSMAKLNALMERYQPAPIEEEPEEKPEEINT